MTRATFLFSLRRDKLDQLTALAGAAWLVTVKVWAYRRIEYQSRGLPWRSSGTLVTPILKERQFQLEEMKDIAVMLWHKDYRFM